MNDILKQRLVGALVIILLGLVFWPIIFVTPELEPIDRASQVPLMPEIQQRQLPAPKPLPDLPPARYAEETAEKAPVEAKPKPQPAPAIPAEPDQPQAAVTKPGLDADGIPVAWTLQVVTVGSEAKAEELVTRLIAMGYKAYIKSLRQDAKTLYRVYVGPKFAREDMLAAKTALDKELRVNSMVLRYLP